MERLSVTTGRKGPSLCSRSFSPISKGSWTGFRRHGVAELAAIDIDWVYNSMPPVMGQVYPPLPLQAVSF